MDRKDKIKEYKRSIQPMGVYQIRNKVNGKIFIGRSKDLKGILNRIKFQLKNNLHVNKNMQNDFNEMGEANFSFEILDYLEPKEDMEENYKKELRKLTMNQFNSITRRNFLKLAFLSSVMPASGFCTASRDHTAKLIEKIESSIIWPGRIKGKTWFHPRACRIPASGDPVILMTCQSITGSDVFGQVYWSRSADNGKSWTQPQPIISLGRRQLSENIEEGVCDVVPDFHSRSNSVLAIGHNVYYKDNVLTQPYENRYPMYVVGDANGNWSDRKKLEWDNPERSGIYTCGCAQRITFDNGNILLPLSFGPKERKDRKVCTVLCSFNGNELNIIKSGNVLELKVKRGLLEPSLALIKNRFFMTIRAEDGFGYVSVSDDGLLWEKKQRWCWDDGEPLTMSTTQQRWISHSQGLFLVYTRKSANNINVMRWRAPLYIAEVDTDKLFLIRESEQLVFPLIGDGIYDPDHVARMGNFHTVNASRRETWVTVGETLPLEDWKGNTLLGRIYWNQNNELVHF